MRTTEITKQTIVYLCFRAQNIANQFYDKSTNLLSAMAESGWKFS